MFHIFYPVDGGGEGEGTAPEGHSYGSWQLIEASKGHATMTALIVLTSSSMFRYNHNNFTQ